MVAYSSKSLCLKFKYRKYLVVQILGKTYVVLNIISLGEVVILNGTPGLILIEIFIKFLSERALRMKIYEMVFKNVFFDAKLKMRKRLFG